MVESNDAEKYRKIINDEIEPEIKRCNSILSDCNSFKTLVDEKTINITDLKTDIMSINNLLENFIINGKPFLYNEIINVASECDIIVQCFGVYMDAVNSIIVVCSAKLEALNARKFACERMIESLENGGN